MCGKRASVGVIKLGCHNIGLGWTPNPVTDLFKKRENWAQKCEDDKMRYMGRGLWDNRGRHWSGAYKPRDIKEHLKAGRQA
jgi:hypothetical protein